MGDAQRAREAFAEVAPHSDAEARDLAGAIGAHAPSLFAWVLADPSILDDVRRRPLDRADEASALAASFAPIADLEDGPELLSALRKARHRAMVRIALREVLGLADVDRTAEELAVLASVALDAALVACRRSAEARHGAAVDERGNPVPLVALGMGKLGGGELNLGSDVDLIFFYETDDAEVRGGERGGELSVHELFARVVRRTSRALAEVTEDGFVFRVDLRLRPEGSRGPLANSLASAERYYESFGRPWERAALLRARPVAGDRAFGERVLEALRPFVWRRSVDPSIAQEMRAMVERSRRELHAGDDDVKLGRGGIREAEFFVQTLQLVWGGRHAALRVSGTIEALRRLRTLGYVTHGDADALETAWALLRRVEHRIHMVAGYQTHALPAARDELGRSLGFASAEAFDAALARERKVVAKLFDSLVDEGSRGENRYATLIEHAAEAAPDELAERLAALVPVEDPDEAVVHLQRLVRAPESPFGALGRARRPGFAASLLSEVRLAPDPLLALRYLTDLFLRGGSGYDAMLEQEPRLARRLVGLFGRSPMLAELLVSHPESLGEIFAGASAPTDAELVAAHGALVSAEDVEGFVAELRRVRREQLVRVGLAFVGQELGSRDVQRRLSTLAETQVDRAFRFALAESEARFGRAKSAMAVVGMGKLGGGELGFTSDLDLVFLYGEDGETEGGHSHVELFSRVAQRTLRLLSQLDAEGPGYEIDTRLRPSGSHGLLVVSRTAFERYHASAAEGWERQALVRARVVAASTASFAADIDVLLDRTAYAGSAPDPARMVELRTRMQRELAGEKAHRYHPKLGFGGLVDIELATQWLQLRHGDDPRVHRRHTLDALDALAPHVGAAITEAWRDGYRFFRSVEQTIALLDASGDGGLVFGGPRSAAVARALGVRERDGRSASESLRSAWERRAEEVRAHFERCLGPVAADAPWAERAGR
ncbi:MAG: bifunctional [glutamate--ammonia ligase]-adenylyl-L-tyrosine phosphorylase/[glutamate--ammonia-ligase] adenylyltransferase [Sandaracinus sp.]|nr:bifunctional [glutamate--ammonia ligase]-adenylyl-L-tyrosine phosphorylase/[glutamate--ammonia-ligase] adenylyltransferase [Sandaracinus sp.]